MAKVSASDLRPGSLVAGSNVPGQAADRIFVVDDFTKGKAGKGGAYLQVKLRNFREGGGLTHKFWADDKVELIDLDPKQVFTFLYADDDDLYLMDMDTGDQIEVPIAILGAQKKWLVDGTQVTIQSYEGKPVLAKLPEQVTLEVTKVKNPTNSTDNHKIVTLETGARIRAPAFIEVGERVIVQTDPRDEKYLGRSKDDV